jgi:hypothetical protein
VSTVGSGLIGAGLIGRGVRRSQDFDLPTELALAGSRTKVQLAAPASRAAVAASTTTAAIESHAVILEAFGSASTSTAVRVWQSRAEILDHTVEVTIDG